MVDHFISGCLELAKTDNRERHNKAAAYIQGKACQHYKDRSQKKWFEHMPETVTENEEVTILCDMQKHTDSGSCHRTTFIQRLTRTKIDFPCISFIHLL